MREVWGAPVGLSDHSMGAIAAIAAVALGACVFEKHLTNRRVDGGPDAAFSAEPHEFRHYVEAIREAHACLGQPARHELAKSRERFSE